MYELIELVDGTVLEGAVRRKADMAVIPFDENNRDYQEYLAWLSKQESTD